jgi:hypothetical protein
MNQKWMDADSAFSVGLKAHQYGMDVNNYHRMIINSLAAPEVPDTFETFEDSNEFQY